MGTAITMVEMSNRPKPARYVRVRYDKARDRQVLLGPETVVMLNQTGAAIVELCDGQRTVAEIVAQLSERYGVDVEEDVRRFLTGLVTRRCVEINDG